MQEVSYDIDSLKDLYVTNNYLQLGGILSSMRDYSSKGHPIIIEQNYNNAPSDLLARLSSINEVNDWIKNNFPGFDNQDNPA